MSLPAAVLTQDRLRTVNIHAQPSVREPVAGYQIHPLFLDQENGVWVLYAKFPPGTLLPRHFHTGTVHFFTTKGTWHYVEHPEDPQTAGSYLYEPAGSVHQFCVPEDAQEDAEGFMVVSGANINFDDRDQMVDTTDAGSLITAIQAVCAASGQAVPRYITPAAGPQEGVAA